MTTLAHDLGVLVVAEGVETLAERNMLVSLGCDLLQGYLLAKPGKPFPTVSWPA
jgi:EAL domain-containing protein (putative c-di-GMP-specific phosphodiesterase class I)